MSKGKARLARGLSLLGLCAAGCFDFDQYEILEPGNSGTGGSLGAEAGGGQSGSTSAGGTSAGVSGAGGGCAVACAGSCVAGHCVDCEVGATECSSGTQYRECSAQGVWSELRSCTNQACTADGCQGVCEPKRTRCSSGNASVQTCTDQGQWGPATACARGCSGSSCLGECTAGEKSCFDEDEAQSCTTAGQWQTSQCSVVCNSQSGSCAECDSNWSRCDPSSLLRRQICVQGSWVSLNDCPFHCQDDAVSHTSECNGECTPGQTPRCKPNESDLPQRCNSSYQWEDQNACEFVCSAGGACTGSCKPQYGRFRCSPTGEPEKCDGTGAWQPQGPCPSGKACVGVIGCQ